MSGHRPPSDRNRSQGRGHPRLRRILDVALVVICLGALVYVVPVADEVIGGYSQVRPTPEHMVRLELVNASGDPNLGHRSLAAIQAAADRQLAIDVVEKRPFEAREIARSFVVSRVEDLSAARILADRLGLDSGDVGYKPLVNNQLQVTATLVLGSDGLTPRAAMSFAEEN